MTHHAIGYAYPEGLGYLYPEGLGAVASSDWTHTARGSCEPTRPLALMHFRAVQSQANRVLKASGKPLLKVDGIIGKRTLAAVNSILGSFYESCDEVAGRADTIAGHIMDKANSIGAPMTVRPPTSTRTPVITTDPESGQEIVTYKEAGFGAMLRSPLGIAAMLIGGLLIWQATKKPRKKRRRKKAASRYKKRVITTWI